MAEKLAMTEAELNNCACMVVYAGLAQGHMSQLLAEVDRQRERIAKLERMFCDLTPGGSEFYADPKRCAAWAQDQMATSQRIAVEASGRANDLERQLAEAQERLRQTAGQNEELHVELQQMIAHFTEAEAGAAEMRKTLEIERSWLSSMLANDIPDSLRQRYDDVCDALRPDAGKSLLERYRTMQIITDAAMQLALKYDAFNELVTFSDGENVLRGTINDALDKYVVLFAAKED